MAFVLAVGGDMRPADARSPQEYQVKAAFVLNFLRLTTWPDQGLTHDAAIRVCTVGTNRFDGALRQVLKNAEDAARYTFLENVTPGQALACRAVFLFDDALEKHPDLFRVLHGRGILSISETEGWARKGSIINLTTVGRRVRFEVNVGAARSAGLILDSSILRLGKIVE